MASLAKALGKSEADIIGEVIRHFLVTEASKAKAEKGSPADRSGPEIRKEDRGIETEIFVIATNRRDGGAPNPVKILGLGGPQIFFTELDAVNAMEEWEGGDLENFGVYRGVIQIEEKVPLSSDNPKAL
jgi:hypothetical protein